jgi:hypothetical protein
VAAEIMAEASLLFVRDDRAVADRLARALEAHGVAICASASAYESSDGCDAAVALFSSAAVKSPLLMERALAAEAEGKLVPVFAGFCHLQAPLNKLALHDLCEWNGDESDVAFQAIRAHVIRIARARAAGEILKQEMRSPEPEPPPPAPPAPDPVALRRREEEARRERGRIDQEATLARLERERQERAQMRAQEEASTVERARRYEEEVRRAREQEEEEEARRARERAETTALQKSQPFAAERQATVNGVAARTAASAANMAPSAAATSNSAEDRLRREREHRERELGARRAAQAPSRDRREADQRGGAAGQNGLGDPFGGRRAAWTEAASDATFERETPSRRRVDVSDWASDVLVMTLVAVGAMAAIVISAQPDAAQAVAQGLQQEVAALIAQLQ